MQNDHATIAAFEVANVKKIKLVRMEVCPETGLLRVAGQNAAGKSSLLYALWAVFNGSRSTSGVKDDSVIHDGQNEGYARVQLTNGMFLERTFRRKRDGSVDSAMTLKQEDAAGKLQPVLNPAKVVEALCATPFVYSPLEFARAKPADRLAMLKRAVGLEAVFAELDAQRKAAYDDRTAVNREEKSAAARLAAVPPVDGAPRERVDVSALTAEIDRATALQKAEDAAKAKAQSALARLEDAKKALAAAQAALAEREREFEQAKAEFEATENVPDVADLTAQIDNAQRRNQLFDRAQERARLAKEHAEKVAESEALSKRIEEIDAEKQRLMAEKALPGGLTIGDDDVMLNGRPFASASTAEKLRAGMAVGVASMPTVRVFWMEDGPMLDRDSIAALDALAKEFDAQIIVERVEDADAELQIVDGEAA